MQGGERGKKAVRAWGGSHRSGEQTMRQKLCFLLFLPLLGGAGLSGSSSHPADSPSLDPGPDSRCPVCGMFVAGFPNWIAQVEFQDGSTEFFDGAKDMFRYFLSIRDFRPGSTQDQIARIFVTEYYTTKRIAAQSAFFVIGSDVNGPMGKELVAFATEEAATEFREDHHGTQVLRFSQVDRDCIDRLK